MECSWHTLGRRPRTFVAFLLISSCKLQHFVKRRRAYGPFFTRFRPVIYSLFFRFSAFSATFLTFFRLALPRIPHGGGVGWGGVGWGGMITFICTSHRHVNATSKVAGHTLMSEDIKAMVNQWVFRQSLVPITPIAFLDELKRLLKQ